MHVRGVDAIKAVPIFALLLFIGIASALVTSVTLNSPANNTWTSDNTPDFNFTGVSGTNTTLSCTLTVDNLPFGTNGSTANNTATVITANASLSQGARNWYVNCTDSGNTTQSEIRILNVDTTVPTAAITSPSNNTNTSDTTPEITFNLTDNLDSVLNYTIFVDGAANSQTGTSNNNSATLLNISALSQGTHAIIVQATDEALNKANSTALTITVDTTVPTSTITSPSNNTWTSDTTPEITFNLTDNLDTGIAYTIFVDGTANGQTGTSNNNSATLLNISALSQGTHTIIVEAADDASNKANSTALTVNVDTTVPTASITSPANNTWTSDTTPEITFNLTDNLDTVLNYTIFVDGTANGQTGTSNNNSATLLNISALAEGTHTVIIQATDEALNKANSTALTINVDTTNPTSAINSPANNSWIKINTFNVNFTLTDNLDTVLDYTIYIDGVANVSATANNNTPTVSSFTSGIADGNHTIIVQATDNAGNKVNSTAITLNVDTVVPTSTINSPANNTWTSDTTPQITFNLTDNLDTVLNYTVFVNGVITAQNGTSNNNTAALLNLSALGQGVNVIIVEAKDEALNAANSTPLTLNVDTTAPTLVNITSPPNNTNTTDNTPEITFIMVDNLDTVLNYTIFVDGTANGQSGTSNNGTSTPLNISSLANGTHAVIVQSTDEALNKANSTALTLTVDQIAPSITLNSPANGTNTTSAAFSANFTINENYFATANCTLATSFGSSVNNNSVLNGTATTISSSAATSGIYYWNITCNDALGNSNISETRTWTFDNDTVVLSNVTFNQTDIFYSNASGNNVLTIIVNASDVGPAGVNFVTANFSALTQPGITLVNMTNYAGNLWNATINITNVTGLQFAPRNVTVFAFDRFGNAYTGQTFNTTIIYNMTVPPVGACMQWDAGTTDLSAITNFGSVNLVMVPKFNLSCMMGGPIPGAPAWTNGYERMSLINFTSLNMSSQTIGTKLQGLPNAMQINITPPGQFGNSRIYFNTTFFAELNTTTSITLYHLPFASQPAVVADADAAGYNASTLVWSQGVGEGNLTLTVFGFSGYNISDNVTPLVVINTPASAANLMDNTPQINVTLNGTKTQISSATFTFTGATNVTYVYNSSTNTANCINATEGSELFYCVFNTSTLADGNNYNLTAVALDYGGASGNSNTTSILFNVDATAPTVSLVNTNATWYKANFSINATVSDPKLALVQYRFENSSGSNVTAWANMSNTSATAFNASVGITALSDANYTVRINASDSFGNFNDTQTLLIFMDDTVPVVSSFTLSSSSVAHGGSLTGTCSATDNSQSFGGSVSTVITGIDTSIPGTFTAACTATDTASNTATSTQSYTVVASGGTGTGGAAPAPQIVNTISSVPAGSTAIVPVALSGIAVSEVAITVENAATNVQVSVKAVATPPADAPSISIASPTGQVYSYLEIKATNLPNTNIKKAAVKFEVPKSWLSEKGLSASDLALYRLTTGWDKLATRVLKEDANKVYFEADTPGFSTFAVFGSNITAPAAAPPAPTTAPAEQPPAVTTPPEPAPAPAEVPPAVTTAPAEAPPAASGTGYVVAVVVIGIIIIGGVAYLLWKDRKHKRKHQFLHGSSSHKYDYRTK